MEDERRSRRKQIEEPIAARLYLDTENATFVSFDASVGGIGLEGVNQLDEGTEIPIVYDLPDDHFVEGLGTVQWCRKRDGFYDMGVVLSDLSITSDVELVEYLKSGENRGSTKEGEKRTHPRYRHTTKIYTGGHRAELFDLGEDGCGFVAELEIEPGSFISLVFSVGADLLKAHGRIKWSKPAEAERGHVYGVEFWHINTQSRVPYQALINHS